MTARTHDAFAFASLIAVAAFYPPTSLNFLTLVIAVIANNIGALIPDMDSAGNRLWDLLPLGDHLAKIFRRIFYKHRTISHSILGVVVIYLFLSWLFPMILNPEFLDPFVVLAAIMIGYVSHIFADGLTKEGVPLLFPFKLNFGLPPAKSMRIKTGGKIEKYIVYPGILVILLLFIYMNQDKLADIILLTANQ